MKGDDRIVLATACATFGAYLALRLISWLANNT